MVGGTLGTLRRRGDDADFDVLFLDDALQIIGARHLQPVDLFADLEGIAVERADDVESTGLEFSVVEQGATEVAHADERSPPFPVYAEGGLERGNKAYDIVADTAYAEFSKVGEVLAYLGRIDVARLRPEGRKRSLRRRCVSCRREPEHIWRDGGWWLLGYVVHFLLETWRYHSTF